CPPRNQRPRVSPRARPAGSVASTPHTRGTAPRKIEGPQRRAAREATVDREMELMRDAKTIAVVGVSSDPSRPSHDVARYLIDAGFEVYLVNPTEEGEILGRPVYARVQDLP